MLGAELGFVLGVVLGAGLLEEPGLTVGVGTGGWGAQAISEAKISKPIQANDFIAELHGFCQISPV